MILSKIRFESILLLLAVILAPASLLAGTGSVSTYDIQVVSDPDSAVAQLDDSTIGVTPFTAAAVKAGNHTITLRKKGYYQKKSEIMVDSLSPHKFSFSLLKPAALFVTTTPAGAMLLLDGRPVGITPATAEKIKPGDHKFAVQLNGYNSIEKSLSLQSGATDTVGLNLDHSTAWNDSIVLAQKKSEKKAHEKLTMAVLGAIFCILAVTLVVFQTGK